MRYTRIEPLSEAELDWALRYYEQQPTGEISSAIAKEFEAMAY